MFKLLEVFGQILDSLVKLVSLSAEVFVLLLQVIHISVRGGAESLLNELNCVSGLFGLFVETNQYLGQLVDYAGAFEVLSKFLLLLFSGLNAHFGYYCLYLNHSSIILSQGHFKIAGIRSRLKESEGR